MSTYGNEPQNPNDMPSEGQVPPPGGEIPPPPAYGQPAYGQPNYGQPDYGQAPPPPPPGGYGYGGGGQGGGQGGYSIGEAYKWAWSKFQANALPLIGFTLLMFVAVFVVSVIGGIISSLFDAGGTAASFNSETGEFSAATEAGFFTASSIVSNLFSLLGYAVSLILSAILMKGALSITYGRGFTDLFSGINWLQVVIASLILAVLTFIGILLCVLPGIAVMIFTIFTMYFIIDKNQSAIDAIKSSVALVKPNFSKVLVLILATIATYIVGFLACCIGIVVAMPLIVLVHAYSYRTLQGETVAP